MKIGILGGSLDPIHYGHLYMAKKAMEEYRLDTVWLIPTGHSPNKDEEKMTSGKDRAKMCRLAVETEPYLKVNTLEVASPERSYTYRTMQKLSVLYPDDSFFFIMGADSLDYFEHWIHPEIICALADILVVNRNAFAEQDLNRKIRRIKQLFPCEIHIVHCQKNDISSSMIRSRLALGQSVEGLLPDAVIGYIREKGLYYSNGVK